MIRAVKGFKDILPEENLLRNIVLHKAKTIFEANGFKEITPPVLEKTELFLRTIGEATDIVQKEMYTFEDKGGEMLSLRPEGTASVVRAFIENSLYNTTGPHKYYYYGPMFRRERPQKGRLRQFYQIGVEFFSIDTPLADAHIIFILYSFLTSLNLLNFRIEINSVGCPDCRPIYEEALRKYFQNYLNELCDDCKSRIEKNPLRILDCKKETCSNLKINAPKILDYLCAKCREFHEKLKNYLQFFEVPFAENPLMVRGLDYYTKTVFEAIAQGLGSQNAVGAGGRYNNLVKEIGGKDIPGIGFALGMERLIILMDSFKEKISPDFYLVIIGENCLKKGIEIYKNLTNSGLKGELDYQLKGLKNQLKKADRIGVKFALLLGEEEINNNQIVIRNMKNGEQKTVEIKNLKQTLKEI
jgi:histidyl-tRNA synthetase